MTSKTAIGIAAAVLAMTALAPSAQAATLPITEDFTVDCATGPDQSQTCWLGHWTFFSDPPEVVHARFTASPEHCSDIRAHIFYENQQEKTMVLKPGASTGVLVFHRNHYPGDKDYPSDQGVFITADGIKGGCNTGTLQSFGGKVEVW
ncbi:MAG: hypothetical protein H6523_02310 [Mycolicibacterium sp.]|jgi:hypothetical protein|nr:hypothetical protein [Mycolicibacterium sp.]